MNELSLGDSGLRGSGAKEAAPLVEAAFWQEAQPTDTLIAIVAEQVDVRMLMQQSQFTIHGSSQPLEERARADDITKRFVIDASSKNVLRRELGALGITYATLFPDLEHLTEYLVKQTFTATPRLTRPPGK